MDITERIQMLLCKARHPSSINSQLEIRAEIQKLQLQREAESLRSPLDRSQQES